jgi:hypothetical protein
MSATEQAGSGGADRVRTTRHESFLAIGQFRYLKLATLTGVLSLALYIADRPLGGRYGGSLAGYILGTVGALLILWLTWFGYKKRSFTAGHNRLAARLSAHVYLGLVLLLIATLHTGFHFGWNVHTLAFALMCIVIFSGVFGVFCYAHYPRMMTENRASMTMQQMLGRVATLNDELRAGALPLDDATTALVQRAIDSTEIGGSTWRQLSGKYPKCATAAAIRGMDATLDQSPTVMNDARRRVRVLLDEKAAILARIRRDISIKAMMDIWLYFHVPMTFALLAALLAHIVSVFFLW